ncbi:MAG: hypothetical protein M5U34_19270 [Chloroflexi bacterium]|nr:hypothetical protein [Chloroflexota bacterium]
MGREGKVAYVYPGAFSAFPGLGRDLFPLFPQLHPRFAEEVDNPGHLVGDKMLYPRSMHRLSEKKKSAT